MGATMMLAEFVAEIGPQAIPNPVLHQAKRCLLDWAGVTLAGAREPAATIMLDVAREAGDDPQAAVFGTGRRVSAPFAALANGFASHLLDYDDTYNPGQTTVHGSAPVWPVILALAERESTTGQAALVAFAIGFEVEIRVALAAGPSHYDAGWHVTGTVGHFGAAAAAARLLGLRAPGVVSALGTAGTQAAGLKQVYGSMGKALHPGKAAMDGLLAAQLAAKGFTSDPAILEGKLGFLNVYSARPEIERLTSGLGNEWAVLEDGFKPYACGSLMHPTIEAVIALRDEHALHPQVVERIESRVHSYVSWVTAKDRPTTGLEGKFSIFHAAAVALVDGAARLDQFTDERVNDPVVRDLGERVHLTVDDDLAKDAAIVTITLRDGRQVRRAVAHNKGTPSNPMSDTELEDKFLHLATPSLGDEAARAAATAIWNLDQLNDAGGLARQCGGSPT